MKGVEFPNKKQLWLIVVILALVIFYLAKCRKIPQPNIITTSKILKDTIRVFESDRKRIEDSFNILLSKHYIKDGINEKEFYDLVNKNTNLIITNNRLQKELKYPDTCNEIVSKLELLHNGYVSQTQKTIEQAKKSLINLSQTIQTQKNYLAAKDGLLNRQKSIIDTCVKNTIRWELYAKKMSPKRELSLIITGANDFSSSGMKLSIGAGISYRNRKSIEIFAMYYSNNTGVIGIKKTFAKF